MKTKKSSILSLIVEQTNKNLIYDKLKTDITGNIKGYDFTEFQTIEYK